MAVKTRAKYDWDKWLKVGAKTTLTKGKHFTCTIRTMSAYVYARARAYNVQVSVREVSEGKLTIIASKRKKR